MVNTANRAVCHDMPRSILSHEKGESVCRYATHKAGKRNVPTDCINCSHLSDTVEPRFAEKAVQ